MWDVTVQSRVGGGGGLDFPDTRASWFLASRFLGILVISIGLATPCSHSDITANSATLAQQRSFSGQGHDIRLGDVKLVCACVITAPDRAVELPTAYGFSAFSGGAELQYSMQDPPCKSISTQIHESVMPFTNTSLRAFLFRTRHEYSTS